VTSPLFSNDTALCISSNLSFLFGNFMFLSSAYGRARLDAAATSARGDLP